MAKLSHRKKNCAGTKQSRLQRNNSEEERLNSDISMSKNRSMKTYATMFIAGTIDHLW